MLQSPLSGALPAGKPPGLPVVEVTPVQPNAIGPRSPIAESIEALNHPEQLAWDPNHLIAPEEIAAEPVDEVREAIVSEILPPAIDPVIPGDIRPTQRVGLRPAASADNPPRPRLIREQKSRGWLKRLIGD